MAEDKNKLSKRTKTGSSKTSNPAYITPSTGIFRILPVSFVPYAELMRLDRPAGYYAFFWHYLIGISFAASISPTTTSPMEVCAHTGYLSLWVLVYRGAVCTWNDNIDQEFDRQVVRCRNRPIARGAGHVFTAAQTALCAVMLLCFPTTVSVYAGAMTIVLGFYPFGKRITDFPQVILGFAFALPIFLCAAALRADPLLEPATEGLRKGSLCVYGASTLWTIIFDTIYAHQDIKDDIKAGVKSLAVRLGDQSKLWLGVLSGVQVGLLLAAGAFCGLGWVYYVVGCGGSALSLFGTLWYVNLENPASCAWCFGPGSRFVGASVVLGFLGHYALQLVM
ncbi:4-hydroxybenzoate polyprenyltransferase [Cercospora zeina]